MTEPSVDLHGLTRNQAIKRLADALCLHKLRGTPRIKVITGRGHSKKGPDQGVLRLAVPDWLDSPRFRSLLKRVEPIPGNPGAVWVTLKTPAPKPSEPAKPHPQADAGGASDSVISLSSRDISRKRT